MRLENLTVVIVKSHPLLVETYRNLLKEIENSRVLGYRIIIEAAFDYQGAIDLFVRFGSVERRVDLVILDLKVFDSRKNAYLAGEDVGSLVREYHPSAKIIFSTTFKNNYRVLSILKSINPEGFLVKADVDSTIFRRAIVEVLNGSVYYSWSVSRWVNKLVNCDFVLDNWDRLMLYELSQGAKMKDLPAILPFSLPAIEKRKKRIKYLFGVEEGDTRQLLLHARKFGFI